MINDILGCEWSVSHFLIISENVFDPLIYYSHFFPLIITLFLGLFVFIKNRKLLLSKVFFALTLVTGLWIFSDIVLWADPRPELIMFFWSITILTEPIIYVLGFYFLRVYINNGEDVRSNVKNVFILLLLPTFVLLATRFSILGFNYTNCDREVFEGLLVYYGYIVELLIALWATVYAIDSFKKLPKNKKAPMVFIFLGVLLFFFIFSWGNIVGTISEDWTLGQYGLFGIPLLFAFLTYAIVKYKTFNIKLIGAQALVISSAILVSSLLLIQDITYIRTIVIITLVITSVLGILLIRGVKREISQREKIEKLADELKLANEGQVNLIHVINHQVKGYMAKGRNIFAELLTEPSYGPVSDNAKPLMVEGQKSLTDAVNYVQQILNASNVERGTMVYNMSKLDLKSIVEEVFNANASRAKDKSLAYNLKIDSDNLKVNADPVQIREAIKNLIDNSITYTEKGSIEVELKAVNKMAFICVNDTGIGITSEDKKRLFTKGGRGKDSMKINVNSTGYGLAFVKGVAEAHGGKVSAESEGKGKGSQFCLELPLI